MMDWQPIETAPKDRVFLASDGRSVFTCGWGNHYVRGPDGDRYGWVRTDAQLGNVARPTHWMPLPEPPA